jgi:hypothetical protein
MTKGFALVLVLILIASTYWQPFRRLRIALGIDYLLSTGHVFLLLGYLLGLSFGDQSKPLAAELMPIVAFVAGWVGFASGMRFDARVLRTVPGQVFAVALAPALAAALIVGAGSAAVLVLAEVPTTPALAAALMIGAAAASSGPALAAVVRGRRAGRSSQARPVLRMIEFSAGIDDLVVIVLATLALGLFRPGVEQFAPAWLIAVAVGGSCLLGGITWLFLGGQASEDEQLLLGLAMLAFTAGFASWLHLAPAAVAAVTAMGLVNLPDERSERLFAAVRRVERPAVVILMTVIGYHMSGPISWVFWPLLAGMTILRMLAKVWAGGRRAMPFVVAPGLHASRGWALGLTPQGVLGLTVALSFFHVWQSELARTVLAAIALASVLNELVAPWMLLGILKRLSRDHRPAVEEAA